MNSPLLEFLLFFAAMWLGVTTLLGFLSGWFSLMERYPDRLEPPLLTLKYETGSMGSGVVIRGALHLSVCPTGLRIGFVRVFGPFCRTFFVPWEAISVTRRNGILWRPVTLEFGSGFGRLSLPDDVANRLARAAGQRWAEPGPLPTEPGDGGSRILVQWLAMSAIGAGFFFIVPWVAAPARSRPPAIIAVLFPLIVFGIAALIQYLRRQRP